MTNVPVTQETQPARSATYRIREVDPGNVGDLATIARLHIRLLDFGPMSALGERFVREACYQVPMIERLVHVALCEVEGRPAGFVAYSAKATTFLQQALRRHWVYLSWLLALSLLQDLRRIPRLVRALRVVGSRQADAKPDDEPVGEIVCLAVLPEYLAPRFARDTGRRVAEELVQHARQQLRQAGVKRMRMIVDADNRRVLFLYHRLGGRFEARDYGGKPSVQVWFDLDRTA